MDSEEEECPLCVEVLTAEDLKFEPCPCGYQVRMRLIACRGA